MITTLLAMGLLGGAITADQDPPEPPVAMPVADGSASDSASILDARLRELDQRIAELEQRTARNRATGAFARGTTLLVSGNGHESVLERLRRLEQELAAANAALGDQHRRADSLEQSLAKSQAEGKRQSERADYLDHTREGLTAARATLAERQERIAALEAQLATSELQRLRSERDWYQLAAEVLRLSAERPEGLPDIQARIRERTRDLRTPGSTTPAATIRNAGPAGGRHD